MNGLTKTPERAVDLLRSGGMEDVQIEEILHLEEDQLERGRMSKEGPSESYGIYDCYQALALRTESFVSLIELDQSRVLHGLLGMTSEISELQGAVDNKDSVNIAEEIGDLMWYVALTCDALGMDMAPMLNDPEILTIDHDGIEDLFRNFLIWNLAEITDQVKKQIYYGKSLDRDEAQGHLQTIVSAVIYMLPSDIPLSRVLLRNINKLKERYPDGFTAQDALIRDLDRERLMLEG